MHATLMTLLDAPSDATDARLADSQLASGCSRVQISHLVTIQPASATAARQGATSRGRPFIEIVEGARGAPVHTGLARRHYQYHRNYLVCNLFSLWLNTRKLP